MANADDSSRTRDRRIDYCALYGSEEGCDVRGRVKHGDMLFLVLDVLSRILFCVVGIGRAGRIGGGATVSFTATPTLGPRRRSEQFRGAVCHRAKTHGITSHISKASGLNWEHRRRGKCHLFEDCVFSPWFHQSIE